MYSFFGLYGEEKSTVGLDIENNNQNFTQDVGRVDEVKFTLEETMKLMVYVSGYEGCDCYVVTTPVIYKVG